MNRFNSDKGVEEMSKSGSFFMRFLIAALVIGGLTFTFWGIKEFFESKILEDKATQEAIELLERTKDNPISKEDFDPNFGDAVGILTIDKIGANLPIVDGTSEDDLRKGVGHYDGTSYPLDDDQIVLSGHRDTVFRRMGDVEIGDIMTVRMPYGDFDYEIINTKVVSADDRTIIVPHDEEILTVTTCYPFSYIGNAPDRYIIDAKPVYDRDQYTKKEDIEN